MPVNSHALIARMGNEAGAREEWARFVAAVAGLEHSVHRIREAPGDWGIDTYVGELSGGVVRVWQAKFFAACVAETQRAQVRASFNAALAAAAVNGYTVDTWTLAIPIDLSAPETVWWQGWKTRTESKVGVRIDLWDRNHMDGLLLRDGGDRVARAFFPPFAPPEATPEEALAEVSITLEVRRAADTDPYAIGVARPDTDADNLPYVPRDADAAVARALRDPGFTVVHGVSAAGKSRSLFEAARTGLADAWLVAPQPQVSLASVAQLLAEAYLGERIVLWLDDLDDYLRQGGFGTHVLAALNRRGGVWVLGTIRQQRFLEAVETSRTGERVLAAAHLVRLEGHASEIERDSFRGLYPGGDLGEDGVGEHFVAASRLITRYEALPESVRNLVQLVVDWERLTGQSSITQERLVALWERLFPSQRRDFEELLGVGLEQISTHAALLRRDGTELSASDYIVDFDDGQEEHRGRPIGESVRLAVLELVDPNSALSLARSAEYRGYEELVEPALEKALAADELLPLASARYELGRRAAERGDEDEARERLREVVELDEPNVSPAAALALLGLSDIEDESNTDIELSDLEDLLMRVDRGAAAGFHEPLQFELGQVRAAKGDFEGASRAWWRVLEGSDDGDKLGGRAALELAQASEQIGNQEQRREALRWAVDRAADEEASQAAFQLAGDLVETNVTAAIRLAATAVRAPDDGSGLPSSDAAEASVRLFFPTYRRPRGGKAAVSTLRQRAAAGDAAALDLIVEERLGSVVAIASEYIGLGVSLHDLVQEGAIALLAGVREFAELSGREFEAAVDERIRSSVETAVDRHGREITLPGEVLEKLGRFYYAYPLLTERLGRPPTVEELAVALRLPVDAIQELLELPEVNISLNERVSEESEFGATLPDDRVRELIDIADESIRRDRLSQILSRLPDRSRRVLELRFGFDGQPRTLAEIGALLDLTPERVRQIEALALNTLTSEIESSLNDR